MRTVTTNTTLVNGYVGLLANLSPTDKLDLIAKLTESVRNDLIEKNTSFKNSFGAFESEKSAEEIIDELRSNRSFTRKIESF